MKKRILIGVCLTGLAVFGIAVVQERYAIAEKQHELIVKWDGTEYQGLYEGDVKNAFPEGVGTFVSKDEKITYEGNWKKGKFSGEGTLIYEDGTKESGQFVKGKRNGEFKKQLSDSEYEITNYSNNVPYGVLYKYRNDKLEKKDYYYGGNLVSSILQNAKELSLSEIVNQEIEDLVCFQSVVSRISQLEESCILLLENSDGSSFIIEYSNNETKKSKQPYIPNVKEGDLIELYGYYDGEDTYAVVNDPQYYGGIYPKIRPVWAAVLEEEKDVRSKKEEQKEYSDILENPYLYTGEMRQFELVVDDVIYLDTNGKYYCKAHSIQSEEEIYYIKKTGEKTLLRGMTLSVSGKIIGQYKELQNVENYLKDRAYQNEIKEPIKEIYKKVINDKEQIVNDEDICYEYKIYPLIIVGE